MGARIEAGDPCLVIDTGTTAAVPLWDAIFQAGEGFGIRPVGQDALDVLRVEAGLRGYGDGNTMAL
jgi:glycine cleavage system aminomethyltransferase T